MLVELIGDPGTGKSSVSRELERRGCNLIARSAEAYPLSWKAAGLARCSVPFLANMRRFPARPLARLRYMVQLDVLARAVTHANRRGRGNLVIDQGPFYRLGILSRGMTLEQISNSLYRSYWQAELQRWSSRLRLLVMLTASDAALFDRVHKRGTPHPMLRMTRAEAADYLRYTRQRRQELIMEFARLDLPLRIMTLDTERQSVAETASSIFNALELATYDQS